MADIQRMNGKFSGPELEGEMAVLTGTAPVSAMRGYPREVTAYSRGRGRISVALSGYESCHNGEEIAALSGYDPDGDMENPTGSVFCAHGAGFVVDWDQVEDYMHLERTPGETAERNEPRGPARDGEHPKTAGGGGRNLCLRGRVEGDFRANLRAGEKGEREL